MSNNTQANSIFSGGDGGLRLQKTEYPWLFGGGDIDCSRRTLVADHVSLGARSAGGSSGSALVTDEHIDRYLVSIFGTSRYSIFSSSKLQKINLRPRLFGCVLYLTSTILIANAICNRLTPVVHAAYKRELTIDMHKMMVKG